MKGSTEEHQRLLKEETLAAQKAFPFVRFFNRHVGMFKTMRGTPIKINKKGMSDQYIWIPTEIGIINLETEYKSGNAKQKKEQKTWERFINNMNGRYALIRKEGDLIKFLHSVIDDLNTRNISILHHFPKNTMYKHDKPD